MNQSKKQLGFTLIELLIVIAIMSILILLIVPRLRTVNKDRNIRESARVVGAMFSKASQQATIDGTAGILLERNLNFLHRLPAGQTRGFTGATMAVPYAVNTLYLLRAVPAFTGDFAGDTAIVATAAGVTTVVIPQPLDHDEANDRYFIRERDTIFLNNQSFGYEIVDVVEDAINDELILTLQTDSLPNPADNADAAYKIQRQPRKVESSRIVLPAGYMINLRYSGPVDGSSPYPETVFSAFNTTDDTEARVFFNASGAVDWIQTGAGVDTVSGTSPAGIAEDFTLTGSLFLMVCEDDLELEAGTDQLMLGSNLWVSVNTSGNVSVTPNLGPSTAAVIDGTSEEETFASFLSRLSESRGFARLRQAATQ